MNSLPHPIRYYLAPMEGITTYSFRNAYQRYYGGVDKYFTPFIGSRNLNARERNEILPEHNEGIHLVPQILANRAEEFLAIAQQIAFYGYKTVNLNLGCPSGTVVSKRRGAGFLSVPEELDRFLDTVYRKCPLNISIKTRIGISSLEEWEPLLHIFRKYPIEELILHPRLQREGYGGLVHWDSYQKAVDFLKQGYTPGQMASPPAPGFPSVCPHRIPLCYNGDIFSAATRDSLLEAFPETDTIMIGRGLLRNPGLLQELKPERLSASATSLTQTAFCPVNPASRQSLATLRSFHSDLLERYRQIMSGDTPTLYKMKELWTYLGSSFADCEPYLKRIRKADHMADYISATDGLFGNCRFLAG